METPIVPSSDVSSAAVVTAGAESEVPLSCAGCGGVGCDTCGYGPGAYSGLGMWFRGDYILWWEKDSVLPPLATTGLDSVADDQLAVLGIAGTEVLFGDALVDDNSLSGYRFELGTWIDAGYNTGIFGRYYSSGDREIAYSAGPSDFNVLGIPFFSTTSGSQTAFLITAPGQQEGNLSVNFEGEASGWEIAMRSIARSGNNFRIDYILGFRRFDLDESLTLQADTTFLPGATFGVAGQVQQLTDVISTENQFNGVDLGIAGQSREGCWSMDFMAKIALGQMDQAIDISGSTLIQTPGLPDIRNVGGLFSQESNIGRHESDDFAIIPEFNVNFGYAITSQLDFTFGYSIIYVTDVMNPGLVMDRSVNEAFLADLQPVGEERPQFVREERDYVLQGINFGFTGRY